MNSVFGSVGSTKKRECNGTFNKGENNLYGRFTQFSEEAQTIPSRLDVLIIESRPNEVVGDWRRRSERGECGIKRTTSVSRGRFLNYSSIVRGGRVMRNLLQDTRRYTTSGKDSEDNECETEGKTRRRLYLRISKEKI